MKKPGAIDALSDSLFHNFQENHPEAASIPKTLIKQKIESLREDPFLGKALERETDRVLLAEKQKISGYLSVGSPWEDNPNSLFGISKRYL